MFLQNDVYLLINHLDRFLLYITLPNPLIDLQWRIHILTPLAVGHDLTDLFILVGPAGILRQHHLKIVDLLCDVDLVSDSHLFLLLKLIIRIVEYETTLFGWAEYFVILFVCALVVWSLFVLCQAKILSSLLRSSLSSRLEITRFTSNATANGPMNNLVLLLTLSARLVA